MSLVSIIFSINTVDLNSLLWLSESTLASCLRENRQSSPCIMARNCILLNSPVQPRWRPYSVIRSKSSSVMCMRAVSGKLVIPLLNSLNVRPPDPSLSSRKYMSSMRWIRLSVSSNAVRVDVIGSRTAVMRFLPASFSAMSLAASCSRATDEINSSRSTATTTLSSTMLPTMTYDTKKKAMDGTVCGCPSSSAMVVRAIADAQLSPDTT
mmetsp:Transcript_48919/g.71739  ORF Transcript_48919/g.71739 Transcript_48919/m.71739 type:complete len:209 (+) Transcript_48919:1164-1790(+)